MRNLGFSNLQHVPGVGYVQASTAGRPAARGLGDDGAVMMISGLGAEADAPASKTPPAPGSPGYQQWYNANVFEAPRMHPGMVPTKAGDTAASMSPASSSDLQRPLTLFNVTLPLWAWLAIAALLGGAGGYWWRSRA